MGVRTPKSRLAGTSIVEMLVGGGVVVLLLGMLIPAMGHVTRVKDNVTCASNLRQIGVGIVLYANDHNGRLPGPLLPGQFPYWTHRTQLAFHVRDYLELSRHRDKRDRIDVFVCPAYRRHVKTIGETAVFTLAGELRVAGATGPTRPFGYPNSYYPHLYRTANDFAPLGLVDLDRIIDEDGRPARSKTWAIKDANQKSLRFLGSSGTSFQKAMPDSTVHGKFDMALFLDFSVGRVEVE